MSKSIQEQNQQILHNQKIIIHSLEQLKAHIWMGTERKKIEHPKEFKGPYVSDFQEQQAINYIHNVLIPDLIQKEAEKGDMVAQSAFIEWAAKPAIEYLKTQALIYISKALCELKNQLLPLAVDIADWVLEQLENLLLKQYQNANDDQKEVFKEKIAEKFPNSRLLGKL